MDPCIPGQLNCFWIFSDFISDIRTGNLVVTNMYITVAVGEMCRSGESNTNMYTSCRGDV